MSFHMARGMAEWEKKKKYLKASCQVEEKLETREEEKKLLPLISPSSISFQFPFSLLSLSRFFH